MCPVQTVTHVSGRSRFGCARARGLASKSVHPRSRLRPFLHTGSGYQRPAARLEEHAGARQRRPRAQARRRAGRDEDRGYRSRFKQIGLSLANQGDIDTEAIAGALSTGTHGTESGLAAYRPTRSACALITSAPA